MKSKKELVRVVRSEGDNGVSFSLDVTGKKSGRGAYICNSITCFEKSRKQKGLERSFKCAIPPEVYENLKIELESESKLESVGTKNES